MVRRNAIFQGGETKKEQQQTDFQKFEKEIFILPSLAFTENELAVSTLTRFAKAAEAKFKHKCTRVRARGGVSACQRGADCTTLGIERFTFEVEKIISKVENSIRYLFSSARLSALPPTAAVAAVPAWLCADSARNRANRRLRCLP